VLFPSLSSTSSNLCCRTGILHASKSSPSTCLSRLSHYPQLTFDTSLGRFGTPILANRLILGMYRQIHSGQTQGNVNVATSMSGLKFSPPPSGKPRMDARSSYATSRTRDTWELNSGKMKDESELGSSSNWGVGSDAYRGSMTEEGPGDSPTAPRHPSVWFNK
jgi:hypothetical protein